MASTYSSNLKLQLMGTGDNAGTWGAVTNVNLGTALEESIAGTVDVAFSSSDITLTLTDDNTAQAARNMRLNLTGTSGGARNLIVPAIEKMYVVNNGLADACTVKVSGQTGVAVPAGKTTLLFNNGTDIVNAINALAGLTVVGTSMATSQAFVGSIADTTYSGGIINLSNTSRSVGITADPNNSGASSILNFSVDGSEAMRINSSGNVGIGTTAQANRLEVSGAIVAQGAVTAYTNTGLYLQNKGSSVFDVGAWRSGASVAELSFSTDSGSDAAPVEHMRINNSGNVGIGTASPVKRLTISGASNGDITTLTDAATITPDLDSSDMFTVTLGGNRTLANPSNIDAGQTGSIFIVQDGTGSRTLAWGSYWDFAGGTAPTLSTAAGAVDRVDFIVRTSTSIHAVFTANYS
jgi:hypothetical protein